MKDAQKPDHVSLTTLIGRLREGRFVIPDFQREFEWKPWDIRDLMRSIFLDYYIGSLLLWKGKGENFEALACEPIYGYEGDGDGNWEHIVLDGQQRLTAMYYTFLAPDVPVPNRSNRFLYFIRVDRFMDEAYDEAFDYDWTRRGLNILADPVSQYENRLAYLYFLQELNGIPAYLAFVYFCGDTEMAGPESTREWKGAIHLLRILLGIARLPSTVLEAFVDVDSIR